MLWALAVVTLLLAATVAHDLFWTRRLFLPASEDELLRAIRRAVGLPTLAVGLITGASGEAMMNLAATEDFWEGPKAFIEKLKDTDVDAVMCCPTMCANSSSAALTVSTRWRSSSRSRARSSARLMGSPVRGGAGRG